MRVVLRSLALAAATLACACGRTPCGHSPSSRAVATATRAAGPWREAVIRTEYTPAENRRNGSYSESSVAHTLVVRGDGVEQLSTIDEARPATRDACDQPFTLAFSPDGRVVGISRDGGRAWRYAGLSDQGVMCCTETTAGRAGNPPTAWPTTEQIAIQSLRAAQADDGNAHNVPAPDPGVVAQFLCAHLDDTDVRAALTTALPRAQTWRWITRSTSLMPLAHCFDATRTDPAWRAVMQSALADVARAPGGQRELFARYAPGCATGAAQAGDDPMHCLTRDALAAPSP